MSSHEDFRREETVKLPSNRSFGLVFTAVFLLIGLAPLWSRREVRWWGLIVAAVFLVLALAHSSWLTPLNRLWMRFGLFLHRIVSPIILGFVFFFAFASFGFILRLLGKDPMRRSFDPQAASYWIPRNPPGPARDSMKNQF